MLLFSVPASTGLQASTTRSISAHICLTCSTSFIVGTSSCFSATADCAGSALNARMRSLLGGLPPRMPDNASEAVTADSCKRSDVFREGDVDIEGVLTRDLSFSLALYV